MTALPATYPRWIFDGSEIVDPPVFRLKSGEMVGGGERAVRFLRSLRHPKSKLAGCAFQLDPWQERIVRRTYARNPDGSRIVTQLVLLLPRGNRKTSLAAALALLHTIGPERRGEAVFAAGDRTQANIGFREAANIVREDKRLVAATRIYDGHGTAKRIVRQDDGTFLEVVSSDGKRQHGRTPSFVLADEIHIWQGEELWEALTTGLEKTSDSLLVVATTAGRGQDTLAWRVIEDARKVARGDVIDRSILPVLFEADAECDWKDEEVWRRFNPGMVHGYPSLDGFRRHAARADRMPTDRESFRQLKLNIWLDKSTSPFVEMAVYDAGKAPIDFERLKAEPAYVAIDMSVTTDLTAVVTAWRDPDDDERFIVCPKFFCPANELRRRGDRDGVPYAHWAEEGFITPTPGDVIDYRAIVEHVRSLYDEFHVAEVVYDRAYAMPVVLGLQDLGIDALAMPLDPKSQAAGVAVLERAIGARKLQHGGHPVLRWNVANVSIYTGPSGLRTMHKAETYAEIIAGAQAFKSEMALEQQALDMTAQAAARLRYEQQLLNDAQRAGIELSPQQRQELSNVAAKMAEVEFATMSAAEAQGRAQEMAREWQNIANSAMKGLISDLVAGKDAGEAFAGVLGKIADQLINMAVDQLFANAFPAQGAKGSGGGSSGNWLAVAGKVVGSLFGLGFSTGGHVRGPGTGTSDSIPARLSDGEFVVNAQATARHRALLEQINSGSVVGFSEGGLVGASSGPSSSAGASSITIAPVVNMNAQGGDQKQNADLAKQTSKAVERSMRAIVASEIRTYLRPGNILHGR